jgi:hypothetical protein
MGFQVLTVVKVAMLVFEFQRLVDFTPEDGGSMFFRNVIYLQVHTAL